jgi:hypothetical protein
VKNPSPVYSKSAPSVTQRGLAATTLFMGIFLNDYCLSERRIDSTFKQKYQSTQAHIRSNTRCRNMGWLSVLHQFYSFLVFHIILVFLLFHGLYRIHYISRDTGNTPIVSNMQTVPTVGTFLDGGMFLGQHSAWRHGFKVELILRSDRQYHPSLRVKE